ncbi:hypothetical protein NUW58_g7936 [Xylaria curta]|uniref:Uncharacterized protein n=1 Tax=Xylaria curta TaxID=42375 RepID=A0ACC1NCH1_9PEZI|nr:hypothetical protein NUW58_g7936 [Xylaria curta]
MPKLPVMALKARLSLDLRSQTFPTIPVKCPAPDVDTGIATHLPSNAVPRTQRLATGCLTCKKRKVKDAERKHAAELFGTAEAPTDLATKIMNVKSKTIKLTDKEKKRLQDMIKRATSLDEITRLETMLREGRLPAGVHSNDEMEE